VGAVVALLLLPAIGLCERLPLRGYGPAEGLSSSQVLGVVADAHGFLWVATRDGLSRFDGLRFVHYGVEQGLPVPTINSVLEGRGGGHWVATNGAGVCWLDPEAPRTANGLSPLCRRVGDDVASNRVNVLLEDRRGRLWAGTDAGLYVLEGVAGGGFRRIPLEIPGRPRIALAVVSLAEDGEGSVWIGSMERAAFLFRVLPDGRVLRYPIPWSRGHSRVVVLAEPEGRVWVGQGRHLLAWRPEPAAALSGAGPAASLPSTATFDLEADVIALHRSVEGRVWVGTLAGLVVLDRDQRWRYTRAHGLTDEAVTALAQDRDGNLWIGTRAAGILKLTRGGFLTYDDADGLLAPDIHALFEDSAGRLHVVGGDWVLSRFDGRRFTSVRARPPGTTRQYGAQQAFLDQGGTWWLTSMEGLGHYGAVSRIEEMAGRSPSRVYAERDGLAGSIFRLFEDAAGGLWIGGTNPAGLYRRERAHGSFRDYSRTAELRYRDRTPIAFCEDRAGGVWIGFSEGGLVRHHEGRFTPVVGAPIGVVALYCDEAGRIWVASSQEGLVRVDDPVAPLPRVSARYTSGQGLSSNNVRCIVSDLVGRLYLGTARGVDRLDPASGRVWQLGTSEGLASGFVTVAFRDREGALWFGTRGWLSRLVPESETASAPPPVRIASVRVGGVLQPLAHLGRKEVTGLRLGPGTSELQIEFFGIGFQAGEPLRYQYHLEGADWSPPSFERTVHYAHPSPGRYRFEVRAVAADGVTSASPATVRFEVIPSLWRRGWFQALAALSLGAVLYVGHRYRLGHLLALERLRTRIAADLHDEIGSSLSRMAVLSEVARRQTAPGGEAPRRLEEIGDTARDLIAALGDIVWAVNPQRDDLASLVRRVRQFAGDLLEENGVGFEFQASPDLENVRLAPEPRQQIFLVLKEALHNVARHAAASSATLRLELVDRQLRAEVSDDGRGLSAQDREGDGQGLANMRARAARIGGHLDVDSVPGAGTRVVLSVPLPRGRTNVLWRRRPG
jgi:ligand-binding sensor domain-containing protein/signal transduction histidine kinase